MHDPFLLSGNLGKTEITSQAILATASFPKFQLAQRKATFGYAEQKSIYKEPIANRIDPPKLSQGTQPEPPADQ